MLKENPCFLNQIDDPGIVEFLKGIRRSDDWGRFVFLSRENKGPGIAILKQMVSFPNEVAIFKTLDGEWCAYPGTEKELIVIFDTQRIDVFGHSHVKKTTVHELPSPGDLISFFERARNFLVSIEGLTLYAEPEFLKNPLPMLLSDPGNYLQWRPKILETRHEIIFYEVEQMIKELRLTDRRFSREQYLELLESLKVTWEFFPWDELSDSVLRKIYFGEDSCN